MKKFVLGLLFVLLFSLTAHADAASQQDKAEETPGTDHSSMETADTQGTKREFKDLVIYEPYEYLNSEITGDYDEAHAVKCVNGTFVGTEENGVASWLGIPYAKPPVGERCVVAGHPLREAASGRAPLQGTGVRGRERPGL